MKKIGYGLERESKEHVKEERSNSFQCFSDEFHLRSYKHLINRCSKKTYLIICQIERLKKSRKFKKEKFTHFLVVFWGLWPQDTPISLTASDKPGPFSTTGCINCPYWYNLRSSAQSPPNPKSLLA